MEKRKKKQGNPGDVLALLQREPDTKTTLTLSSERLVGRTIEKTGKTQSDRAPKHRRILSPYRGENRVQATTPAT